MSSALTKIDHFIDGEYTQSVSAATFESINPSTGAPHALVASGDAADIDRAVTAARRAFEKGDWSGLSVAERCQYLKRIGDLIMERRKELAVAESTDNGKPISESFDGDILRSASNFHFFSQFAASHADEAYSGGLDERHVAIREPLGVCGLITPWNLPLYLAT